MVRSQIWTKYSLFSTLLGNGRRSKSEISSRVKILCSFYRSQFTKSLFHNLRNRKKCHVKSCVFSACNLMRPQACDLFSMLFSKNFKMYVCDSFEYISTFYFCCLLFLLTPMSLLIANEICICIIATDFHNNF